MTSDQTVVCSRCGFANVPGDQFCGSCGAFLEWEGTPAAPSATAGPLAAGPPAAGTPSGGPPQGPGAAAAATVPPGPQAATTRQAAPPPLPIPAAGAEGLVRCPSCGIANPSSRTFCQTCGAKLLPAAVVAARSREEIAAAVAAAAAQPRPATQGPPGAGPSASGSASSGRRLPAWVLAVVVLGILVGAGAVAGSQLLNGGGPSSVASAAPTPSGPVAASAAGAGSSGPSASLASPQATGPTASAVAGKPLKLTSASASSILGGNTGKYGPQNAIDGSLKTSWQEGAATEQGQWIEVGFAAATVDGIIIRNGFQASTALYKGNLRLKAIEVSVDGGAPVPLTLKDTTSAQRFGLPSVANATRVRITIVSTYPSVKTSVSGSPFKDAAVSEISVLGVTGG
jgi:uncharacterized OB-fold protein